MAPTMNAEQHRVMAITERVAASISIIGILFIILTYLFASGFSKPINRLVFYASWGNLGMCIVALISISGPDAGQTSVLCQTQGFLAQLFLGVDAYWAFCMAVNIYLVFFRNWNTKQLKGLDRKYLVACYGLSLIPAITYLFIDTKDRGKIYGPAILWCWVSRPWAILRIAILYVSMWVAVLIAMVIYVMAGFHVWKKRDALSGFLNPFNEAPFTSVLTTTEVTVTSASRKPSMPDCHVREVPNGHLDDSYDAYSVNIEIGEPRPSRPALFRIPTVTRAVALSQENADSFLYARVAFLFFVALLVTWVPSSVNRASGLANPEDLNFGLNYTSALVFAMQGILNTMVYMSTSQSACRRLWNKMRGRAPPPMGDTYDVYRAGSRGRQKMDSDATSMTNLTGR